MLALQAPVWGRENFFVVVNTLTVTSLAVFGTFLAVRLRNSFVGWALALAGIIWAATVPVDIYPGWWAFFSSIATGAYYVAFGWGLLRYDQVRLRGAERAFPLVATITTLGGSTLSIIFSVPEFYGYPSATPWITVSTNPLAHLVASVFAASLWVALAAYFVYLIVRRLRDSPPLERSTFYPVAVAGAVFALAAVSVVGLTNVAPGALALSVHEAYIVTGLVSLGLIAGMIALSVQQQLLVSKLFRGLPGSLTPAGCQDYFRAVLADPTFTFHLWDHHTNRYLGVDGYPIPSDRITVHQVDGPSGDRILLLSSANWLRRSPRVIAASVLVIRIIAGNVQLSVVAAAQERQLRVAGAAAEVARQRGAALVRRDLHDTVQQTIQAARLDLEGLVENLTDPSAARQLARGLDRRLDTALGEVRALSRGMNSITQLTSRDLRALIRSVAEDLRLDAEIEAEEVPPLGPLLDPLIRVVREALLNVYKHAGCDRVRVTIGATSRSLLVSISDGGCGGAESKTGGGLAGIVDRVQELGGTVAIESPAGVGTRVKVELPCV